MNTNLLNQLLSEATRGNREASYRAGKLMANEGTFNDVAIQKRYLDAANAGYTEAQKELGALGLCGRLITDDATAFNIHYHTDYNNAIMWLRKAAINGDPESKLVILAVDEFGIKVIEDARKAVDLYRDTLCSKDLINSPTLMLFEIAMQYLDPFGVNRMNKVKTA